MEQALYRIGAIAGDAISIELPRRTLTGTLVVASSHLSHLVVEVVDSQGTHIVVIDWEKVVFVSKVKAECSSSDEELIAIASLT